MAELASQPTSIQSVYSWFREDKLLVNRRYQRKLVWTLEEKQKLVESILKKYPVPAILLAEREEAPGTYEIIDGLQRLHAILSFVETSFPTTDGKFFDLTFFPSAKRRADEGLFTPNVSECLITQAEVSTFLDYSLAMSIMRNATEQEVNDVFDRINTYGHRLSDQERRQSGVQNEFSDMVRQIACTLRGDVSADILPLKQMPSISIDLPMSKHGYEVRADEVFWSTQGILRSTQLRDSMDEQCIADIAACIVGGKLIERSKEALDEVYTEGSDEAKRVSTALEVYGSSKFCDEFKYCIDEILKACNHEKPEKLRDIIFRARTTNPFPSRFAAILIAFHEIIIKESKKVSDYGGIRTALTDIASRIESGQRATSPDERRRNIDIVKGLIASSFVPADVGKLIYGSHASTDIEALIRRSEIEVSDYELKQGVVSLGPDRKINEEAVQKILRTIVALANNGPSRIGKILLGVTDKPQDADRVKELDGVEAHKVGTRLIAGVNREARALGLSVEDYYTIIRDRIASSEISDKLRSDVLTSLDYNSYFGLGIIVITVPQQRGPSYLGEDIYIREGDQTILADTAKKIAAVVQRFN